MRIDELEISDAMAGALVNEGYAVLHPPQAEAIPIALKGKNLVVSIPTASGKSLIGYVPALKAVEEGKKVLYIVPLKALASEKKDDFDRFSAIGVKARLSIGDLDSEDERIGDANVIVATSEKADSMIRHGNPWLDDIGLVIADEIHMIHDPGRGPTLEVALTKLKRRNRNLQIIALSATMSNARDLAEWLDAELVESKWRPIPLKEGVYFEDRIVFDDRSRKDVPCSKDGIWDLIDQTVGEGGQTLVFVNSRRSTEALAVKYCKQMGKIAGRTLDPKEVELLEGDSESTATGRKLSSCVKSGMAFHNAGLTYRQRKYVEDNFRNGNIKCIVATPTLAAGINLPARRVIVRDTMRFESNSGNSPIPVMEVKQMCGRAGRPGYDPYGEAVLVAKSLEDSDHLMEDYIEHDTERLTSKLFNEKVLRSHILGLIATRDAHDEGGIIDFLRDTFFGTTSQLFGIESVVEKQVDSLISEGMVVREDGRIHATPFGKRVSDLYIDPVSASLLKQAVLRMDDDTETFPILVAAAMTPDVLGMYPKKGDKPVLEEFSDRYWAKLLLIPDDLDDYDYEFFDSDLKVAVLMNDWIDEIEEDVITESMGIGPGDIRNKVDSMDWMIYAMNEIALIFNPDASKAIKPLMTRIRYGVRHELIDLVSLRGVGRARARILYDNGYTDRDSVSTADESVLAAVPKIGPALAHSLKEQTVGKHARMFEGPSMTPSEEEAMMADMAAEFATQDEMEKKKGEAGPKQASLFDF